MPSRTKPPTVVPTRKLVPRKSLRDELASSPRGGALLPTLGRVGKCTLVENTTLDGVALETRVADE